jgi:glycosyltransferase involved in cell wall biosynthesis
LQIPKDSFCVLFCGKFIPKKHPFDLVKAAELLLSSHRELKIHLLFVGSGELGVALRAQCNVMFDAERLNSSLATHHSSLPRASFAGFLNQTEISKAYVAADYLVLPSDYRETWGLVVNEAMASGLPCIISDQCGCVADLGSEGSNAVFPCGRISDLAQKIVSVAGTTHPKKHSAQLPSFSQTVSTVVSLYLTNSAKEEKDEK